MLGFLILFMLIDLVQTLYIRHLRKEISARDSATDGKPIVKKENKFFKLLKEIFWI